jgi:hypothetical protein
LFVAVGGSSIYSLVSVYDIVEIQWATVRESPSIWTAKVCWASNCSLDYLHPPPWNMSADVTMPLTVSLNHFRLLRVVGRGAFGKVRIVERKDTGLSFALKYIRKDEGRR